MQPNVRSNGSGPTSCRRVPTRNRALWFLWFASVPPGNFWDRTLYKATTASLYVLCNLLSTNRFNFFFSLFPSPCMCAQIKMKIRNLYFHFNRVNIRGSTAWRTEDVVKQTYIKIYVFITLHIAEQQYANRYGTFNIWPFKDLLTELVLRNFTSSKPKVT